MPDIWNRVLEESELISLPEVYLRLQQVLCREDFAMQEVTEVIQYDPAITTRLLNLVRSAYLGLGPRIDTVSHAVNYLGAKSVHDLVLTTVLADSLGQIHSEGFDLKDFWHRSVNTALIARLLGKRLQLPEAERLFIAGLVHDIGLLLMQQVIPDEVAEIHRRCLQQQKPRHRIERELLGFDAAALGAAMLERWQLPPSLVQTTAARLEPAQAGDFSTDAALLQLAAERADPLPFVDDASPPVTQRLQALELKPEDLDQAEVGAEEELGAVIRLLFPHLIG